MQISKTKKVIYTIIWIAIISYLFGIFLESDPFGKNSAFNKATCKKVEEKINYLEP